ncbi:hypothetical protein [Herbiconiux daphne]|uniref:Uncharacterized protein n=1 Tax=Herbiconiux daphne TaxID=2970914 RepID=A0ABT2HB46_9MICO|nr:hypothetical protein [Herbiconiux daphne]MCS5737175.1 hypothetical protein [Herbiconiux daphne]
MNDLQLCMDQLLDHNEVLHNHADVLEEHEVRLAALESVIKPPAPEPATIVLAEAKVDEPEVGGQEEKDLGDVKEAADTAE